MANALKPAARPRRPLGRLFLAGLLVGATCGGIWAWLDRGPHKMADIGWFALAPALAAGIVFILVGSLLRRPRER